MEKSTTKKLLCEHCRKWTGFTVDGYTAETTIKGLTFNYRGLKAICNNCKEQVYDDDTHDKDLGNMKIAYGYFKEKSEVM